MTTDDESAAELLERDAARSLADALEIVVALRGREHRERHRQLLMNAIEQAERVVASSEGAPMRRALSILARAHAARAEDALHGAGQLSLGAQRAPTPDACDDGWRRVETIVVAAEEAAAAAQAAARALREDSSAVANSARAAAERAAAAARAARSMIGARNDAYTFHTDAGFSFGEGWYIAAAAVLAGVAIQIERGKSGQSALLQAERFLRDAGLSARLQPYRSRPRANKQTTDIVARAFRDDPLGAQEKVRAAFLGAAPIADAVSAFVDRKLSEHRDLAKVLVWVRYGAHHPGRNTLRSELVELVRRATRAGLLPILVGDALRDGGVPEEAIDMTLFWKDPVFQSEDGRRAQLQFFEHLRAAHGVVGQLGVTTAGMDGPALMGMPTMYLTDATNVRMRAWVGAVPGYREIVRESGYLQTVSDALDAWARAV
jgi:hypothetical protein